jgi:hypothetical protein
MGVLVVKEQLIIDALSYLLCTERHKTYIVFGRTVREAADFVERISWKIPDYVGLKRTALGRFEAKTGSKIYCFSELNGARGRAISLAIVLKSVSLRDLTEIKYCMAPLRTPVYEETYE